MNTDKRVVKVSRKAAKIRRWGGGRFFATEVTEDTEKECCGNERYCPL